MYGLNTSQERKELWRSINRLSGIVDDSPWVVLGDFNVVCRPEERSGGDTSWPSYMEDLNVCYYDNSLDDLKFTGNILTWSKGAVDGFLARKLDRVLVNNSWLTILPNAEAEFLMASP